MVVHPFYVHFTTAFSLYLPSKYLKNKQTEPLFNNMIETPTQAGSSWIYSWVQLKNLTLDYHMAIIIAVLKVGPPGQLKQWRSRFGGQSMGSPRVTMFGAHAFGQKHGLIVVNQTSCSISGEIRYIPLQICKTSSDNYQEM